jgi:hypothetical protein
MTPDHKEHGIRSPGEVLLDLAVVVTTLRRCGQATLAAKAGVFLERHQQPLGVPEAIVERLHRMRPKQPHYLARKQGGRMAPGWNLVVPALAESGPNDSRDQTFST